MPNTSELNGKRKVRDYYSSAGPSGYTKYPRAARMAAAHNTSRGTVAVRQVRQATLAPGPNASATGSIPIVQTSRGTTVPHRHARASRANKEPALALNVTKFVQTTLPSNSTLSLVAKKKVIHKDSGAAVVYDSPPRTTRRAAKEPPSGGTDWPGAHKLSPFEGRLMEGVRRDDLVEVTTLIGQVKKRGREANPTFMFGGDGDDY